jgi:hypothetical protein
LNDDDDEEKKTDEIYRDTINECTQRLLKQSKKTGRQRKQL